MTSRMFRAIFGPVRSRLSDLCTLSVRATLVVKSKVLAVPFGVYMRGILDSLVSIGNSVPSYSIKLN